MRTRQTDATRDDETEKRKLVESQRTSDVHVLRLRPRSALVHELRAVETTVDNARVRCVAAELDLVGSTESRGEARLCGVPNLKLN